MKGQKKITVKITRDKEKRQEKKNEKLTCWHVFQCNQSSCPGYGSRNGKCWLLSGTFCRKEIKEKFIKKIEICQTCRPVGQPSLDPPIANLYPQLSLYAYNNMEGDKIQIAQSDRNRRTTTKIAKRAIFWLKRLSLRPADKINPVFPAALGL